MLTAVWLLDCDLRHVRGGGENEIGMLDAILAAVRHPNNKWLKWDDAK